MKKWGKIWNIPPYISECSAQILTKFSDLVDTWVGMINLTHFLQYSKGHCYGAQLILGAKIEHGLIPPFFFALALHNHFDYHHLMAQ